MDLEMTTQIEWQYQKEALNIKFGKKVGLKWILGINIY